MVRDGGYYHADETFVFGPWIVNTDIHFPLGTKGRIEAWIKERQPWQAEDYEYSNNVLVKLTNRNGLSFNYQYDDYSHTGKCIRTWGDVNLYNYYFEYSKFSNETIITNSLGYKEIFEYDENLLGV